MPIVVAGEEGEIDFRRRNFLRLTVLRLIAVAGAGDDARTLGEDLSLFKYPSTWNKVISRTEYARR